jgi:hypothetical protein
MEILIDGLTRKDLEGRYGVTRSNTYNRIAGLKEQGYDLTPDDRGTFSAEQIDLLDRLDRHLKIKGSTIANFPRMTTRQDDPIGLSYELQDVQDLTALSSMPNWAELVQAIAAIVSPPDPLAGLRSLDEAAEKRWLLSSSQVKALVGTAPSGDSFNRYGFVFVKAGRNGRECAWRINKSYFPAERT